MPALRIASPCTASWDAMQPVDGRRFCEACQRKVHDLTRMTAPRALATALVFGGERLCARMRTDDAGGGVFRPAHAVSRARRGPVTLPLVTVAASLGAGCGATPAENVTPHAEACAPTAAIVELAPSGETTRASNGAPRAALAREPAAIDRDGDGVLDADDRCPADAGAAADQGCPAPKQVIVVTSGDVQVLMHPRFASGRSTIEASDQPILDEVVNVLAHNPQITHVDVEGHADAQERNPDALSLARANAVVAYLVGKGASASVLQPVGAGSTKPLDAGNTPAGRAKNRRVEFHVVP